MSDFVKERDSFYNLWKFFKDEHELILTEGQLGDILAAVEVYLTEVNEANTSNEREEVCIINRCNETTYKRGVCKRHFKDCKL